MNGIAPAMFETEKFERLVRELGDGLFVVNAKGEVLCMLRDVTATRPAGSGIIAAIEAVIADTSAAGRFVADKIAALRRGVRKDGLEKLTEREREVLGLICQGHDDGEMSRTLGLSRNTVRNHIASLYRKIGVNRRSAAVIWARERGIVSPGLLGAAVPERRRDEAQH